MAAIGNQNEYGQKREKKGTIHFMSRIMATPELDKTEDRNNSHDV